MGQGAGWCFINQAGNPLDGANFRRRCWSVATGAAGVAGCRIHDLRHFFASELITGGWPLAYIKAQLGHYSIKVTVDIYGHLAPEGNNAAVDTLDQPGAWLAPERELRDPAGTQRAAGGSLLLR